MPKAPPELKQAWIRALHREHIDELEDVFVCIEHFRAEDVEHIHKVPNGDGTFREIPRACPKLKDGAIPCFLPGCSSYYSSQSSSKRSRLSSESKEIDLVNQAINLSLQFENQEKEKFAVRSFQDIKAKLSLLSLTNWSMWFPDDHHIIFMQPRKIK